MTRVIKRKQGDPISSESLEELKRLAEMPDELINTNDIPERPFGTKANLTPAPGPQRPELHRKAS